MWIAVMMPDYFRTLARYNAWANRRVYDACARLDDATYFQSRQAFFGSIHATLNHILVGDRIWLDRMCGMPATLTSLDILLYAERKELATARAREDARILALSEHWTEESLARDLVYTNTRGEPNRTPLHLVVGHFFNHQTHHRGQVHGLLSQTEVPPPPLDLIYYIREPG
jgi:uncharacterized damage-inducible protein DinB